MKAILKSNELIKVTGFDGIKRKAYFIFDKNCQYQVERFIESVGAKLCSISGGFNSPQKTASIKW